LIASSSCAPVFHFPKDRIRAHVQLCWLALLLIRTVEHETGDTWRNVRNELDRMHLVTLETAEGRVAQRSATTPRQVEILRKFDIAEPARFYDFKLPSPIA
jgi:transposase